MKICMAGAGGRMGRRILELASEADDLEVGSAFDAPDRAGEELVYGGDNGAVERITLAATAQEAMKDADVLIDFTFAGVCVENVRAAVEAGKPAIIGTTGLSEVQVEELHALSKKAPIVYAPNMSVGVNLLFKVAGEMAAVLGLDYNVEITEIHHNKKKDSPSGTAVRLAERISRALGLDYTQHVSFGREGMVGERPEKQIGVHALRGGDVVGEHTVAFVGEGERLEITHKAHNRDNFARGSLIAARFVATADPGLYDMQDVLGLK